MSSPVVLCGSLGSTSEMWEPQLPALQGRRVVKVEYPGHGGAPLSDVQTVEDLGAGVLDEVGSDTFAFVGLSLGGAGGLPPPLLNPGPGGNGVAAGSAA